MVWKKAVEGYSEEVAAKILRYAGAPLRMTLRAVERNVEDVAVILRCAQDDYASAKTALANGVCYSAKPSDATPRKRRLLN